MPREQLARLLGPDSSLEVGLGEVSQHGHQGNDGGEDDYRGEGAGEAHEGMGQCAEDDRSGDATSRTLDRLVGADPGSELVSAYGLADEVCTGVGGEYCGEGIEDPVSAFGEVSEEDEVA